MVERMHDNTKSWIRIERIVVDTHAPYAVATCDGEAIFVLLQGRPCMFVRYPCMTSFRMKTIHVICNHMDMIIFKV